MSEHTNKFKLGDLVSTPIDNRMMVIDFGVNENGEFCYWLAFLTKNNTPDKRKNFRFFRESRLESINPKQ
jgi:hypothetical protein